ncbi:hypothetical protein DRH29_03865 [candidate division Kazan bacterium]|uniref:Big-1 domain-containing protein n=1 Tax=candidate division Kazan bacterium TaxID=2202143 RepID=A0A420ZC95_UNCK3|nr:MAG: hypothetical protein DRH29_03865 [candidate division Kazan bacterium]
MPTRTVQVTATLTDTDGNPLSGKPINLYYREAGSTTWNDLGTNPHTTDANGQVTDSIDLTVPGSYDFRAEFPGDDQYEASSAELLNQMIKAKTQLTITVTPL